MKLTMSAAEYFDRATGDISPSTIRVIAAAGGLEDWITDAVTEAAEDGISLDPDNVRGWAFQTWHKICLPEFPSWTAPSDFSPRDAWSYEGWANDACPKWIVQLPVGVAVLWVDYADPDARDTLCPHLYTLCRYDGASINQSDGAMPSSEFGTDSFYEILRRLEELGASL